MQQYIYILIISILTQIAVGYENIKILTSCGFMPKQVLDVGANTGSSARGFREEFPTAKIFMIEGNDANINPLKETGNDYLITLVGNSSQSAVTFFKSKSHHNCRFH